MSSQTTIARVIVPSGYANAEEFAKDCGFELAPPPELTYDWPVVGWILVCILLGYGFAMAFGKNEDFITAAWLLFFAGFLYRHSRFGGWI